VADSEQSYAAMLEEEERRQRRVDARTSCCSHCCACSPAAELMKMLVGQLDSWVHDGLESDTDLHAGPHAVHHVPANRSLVEAMRTISSVFMQSVFELERETKKAGSGRRNKRSGERSWKMLKIAEGGDAQQQLAGQAESVKGRATSPVDDLLECLCRKLWFCAIECGGVKAHRGSGFLIPTPSSLICKSMRLSHCDILHLRIQKHNPPGSAF